jgi:hypothetical protein
MHGKDTTTMRPFRFLLAGITGALLLLPTAALAQTPRAALRDMTCSGIHAAGTGMPRNARLRLELVDEDDHTTLARQQVTTSSAGTFQTTMQARLNRVASIHLTVAGADGRQLAFADHSMDASMPMCSLPFTGASGTAPLLYGGAGLMALGALMIALATWRLYRSSARPERT